MGWMGGKHSSTSPVFPYISNPLHCPQCYLAPPEAESDPAVYGAKAPHKPETNGTPNGSTNGASTNGHAKTNGAVTTNSNAVASSSNGASSSTSNSTLTSPDPPITELDAESDRNSEPEDNDDNLLTVQPGFNRLLLVLRDERVMRFVKYLSASAQGSRWDVSGEWEIGMMEEHDSE